MHKDLDCIFCKIVDGEIPSYKVYEDSEFLAFLDIYPFHKGQTVIIPKEHHRWVWDYPDTGSYFSVVGRIANAMRESLDTDWIISTVVGEEVPHAHVVLTPRTEDDGHGDFITPELRGELSSEEGEMFAEKISRVLEDS